MSILITCITTFLVALVPAVALAIITDMVKNKSIKPTFDNFVKYVLFYVYIISVIYLTMFRNRNMNGINNDFIGVNFQLFSSYISAWYSTDYITWQNIILNIIMTIPLGFFLGLKFKNKPFFPILITILSTVVIEVTQLITGLGEFEVDDIFNNFVGGLFGYSVYILYSRYKGKILKTFSIIIVAIVPCTFLGFFIKYQTQEFGNFTNRYITYNDTSNVEFSSIPLDDTSKTLPVYKSELLTMKELRQYGDDFLNSLSLLDEVSFIDDDYQDLVVYRGTFGYLNLNLDKTYMMTLNNLKKDLSTMTADEVKSMLNEYFNVDINILNYATYTVNNNYYTINIDNVEYDNYIYNGSIELSNYNDNTINIDYNVLETKFYKNIDTISEQDAYTLLTKGKSNLYTKDVTSAKLTDISIVYQSDSKGFYRPTYELTIDTNLRYNTTAYIYDIIQ
ncbi:MAG: VanZ family protein [Oscillospiraceae bacterium]